MEREHLPGGHVEDVGADARFQKKKTVRELFVARTERQDDTSGSVPRGVRSCRIPGL